MYDYDLEGLSLKLGNSWQALARRLSFVRDDIDRFNASEETYTEKLLAMLQEWKQRLGSNATYEALGDALCDELVGRKDLAEMFCLIHSV